MEGFLRAMAVAAALLVPAGAAWAGLADESKPIDPKPPVLKQVRWQYLHKRYQDVYIDGSGRGTRLQVVRLAMMPTASNAAYGTFALTPPPVTRSQRTLPTAAGVATPDGQASTPYAAAGGAPRGADDGHLGQRDACRNGRFSIG